MVLLDGDLPEVMVFENGQPMVFRTLGESEGLAGEEFNLEMARGVSYTLMSVEMEEAGRSILGSAVPLTSSGGWGPSWGEAK